MMLLSALGYYLHYEAPPEEQNFAMVMEMIRAGTIEDEEDPSPTPLDCLFTELEGKNPDHIALKYRESDIDPRIGKEGISQGRLAAPFILSGVNLMMR